MPKLAIALLVSPALLACVAHGPRCTGDAAATLDPAASHGVLKALMSGILAASWIARTLHGVVSESLASEAYAAEVERWFVRDADTLADLYDIFPGWTGRRAS